MFVIFLNICKHTHTQYDYYTLPPMLCVEGNYNQVKCKLANNVLVS